MIPQWEKLKCENCNSIRFVEIIHLRHHPNTGTSTEPAGYMCAECNAIIDLSRLIARLEVAKKKAEISELEQGIKDLGPVETKSPKTAPDDPASALTETQSVKRGRGRPRKEKPNAP